MLVIWGVSREDEGGYQAVLALYDTYKKSNIIHLIPTGGIYKC
jgi:hypothetical protein